MSDYRRNYIKGVTYFFTVVTEKRRPILNNPLARKCLREAFCHCMQNHPFTIDAIVILPNHIHAIWTLPEGDADYSKRWGIIKKISLNLGLNRAVQKSVFLSQNNVIIVVAYGNDDFGNIP